MRGASQGIVRTRRWWAHVHLKWSLEFVNRADDFAYLVIAKLRMAGKRKTLVGMSFGLDKTEWII
jgi:hypothetical protein